jgi:prevent-host-death family protein
MEEIGVRELRNGLSKHLAKVKRGEVITVTEHGQPVARIVPLAPPGFRRSLAELEAQGVVAPAKRPKRELLRPPVKAQGTVSDLIAEQRR